MIYFIFVTEKISKHNQRSFLFFFSPVSYHTWVIFHCPSPPFFVWVFFSLTQITLIELNIVELKVKEERKVWYVLYFKREGEKIELKFYAFGFYWNRDLLYSIVMKKLKEKESLTRVLLFNGKNFHLKYFFKNNKRKEFNDQKCTYLCHFFSHIRACPRTLKVFSWTIILL